MDRARIPTPVPQQQTPESSNEEADFLRGIPEDDAKQREIRREQRFLDAINDGYVFLARIIPILVIILISAAVLVVVPIMGWHYLGPEDRAWLTPGQIDKVETAGGSFALALLISLVRHILPRKRQN